MLRGDINVILPAHMRGASAAAITKRARLVG